MKITDSDDVLLDWNGEGADEKATFELGRKVIGRKVTGVRFCANDEYEPDKRGVTVMFSFEEGGRFILAVPQGSRDIEMFISMDSTEAGDSKMVM